MNSKEVIERLKEFANHFATNGYPYNQYSSSSLQIKSELNIIEKDLDEFSEYKRLEKELGIDLITLFKIANKQFETIFYLDSGKIYGNFANEIELSVSLSHRSLMIASQGMYYWFDIKDYGKTWALTREELENA